MLQANHEEEQQQPFESTFKSGVYVWTEEDTGIRYGVHVPQSNTSEPPPDMDSATLKTLTVTIVHALENVSRPFVLVHYLPTAGGRIELSIPDLGTEEEVRALSSLAESGPLPFVAPLVKHFKHDMATHNAIHVEYIEIRYNVIQDLPDPSRHAIIHSSRAVIPPEQILPLAHFIYRVQSYMPQ